MNEVYEKSFNRMSKDRAQLLRVCYACCHVFVFLLSKLLTFDGQAQFPNEISPDKSNETDGMTSVIDRAEDGTSCSHRNFRLFKMPWKGYIQARSYMPFDINPREKVLEGGIF